VSQLLNEFENVDVDRLVYDLRSLSDISHEIASDSDLDNSLSNMLRILMGTLGATKGSILLYAPYKLAFESSVIKGYTNNVYLRATPKEIPEITEYKGAVTTEDLSAVFPEFIKRNKEEIEKNNIKLWATLSLKGRLVGCIVLGKKLGDHEYQKVDIGLLSIIANQISVAVSNFQLINELKKTNDKLRKQNYELGEANFGITEMKQISVELSSILDVQTLLEIFVERSLQYLSCSKAVLFNTEGDDKLQIAAMSKVNTVSPNRIFKISKSCKLIQDAMETGEPQIGLSEGMFDLDAKVDAKYVICVPLKASRDIIGLLCLFDKVVRTGISTFSERDESMIVSLANHVSTLWQKAKFYEMATIDGLTQLYVRRFLEQRMLEEIRKAQRLEKKLSTMLIDIDHFKKFNDTYGHQTGDEVLRLVAKTIKDSVRKGVDIPARYGGEEIAVVMPSTDSNGAMVLSERIRRAIENAALKNPTGGPNLKVTVSIGVTTFPDAAKNVKELIEKSDIALYKSKAEGRNRVTLYEEEED